MLRCRAVQEVHAKVPGQVLSGSVVLHCVQERRQRLGCAVARCWVIAAGCWVCVQGVVQGDHVQGYVWGVLLHPVGDAGGSGWLLLDVQNTQDKGILRGGGDDDGDDDDEDDDHDDDDDDDDHDDDDAYVCADEV